MATATTIDPDIQVSPGEGRYLCGILYNSLQDDPPITNGDLAEYLDVSGASVSEMIEAFDTREWSPTRPTTVPNSPRRASASLA